MESVEQSAGQAGDSFASPMSVDSNHQPARQTANHHRSYGRRRPSLRLRHMHTAFNTANYGGNRVHPQVPRGVFSPISPRTRRPRTRSIAQTELESQQQPQPQPFEEQIPPLPEAPEVEAQWRPSIVVGSPLWVEGEDLSRIEIADRKIAQRRLWVEHYRGASDFPSLLEDAIRERNQLLPTDEESTQPKSTLPSTHALAVAERVALLQTTLESSYFPPERANIAAAIAGYSSGEIRCSTSYTLIWAGQIVDRCPDYASFTSDRVARLGRYCASHGPGWLWYEPPLSGPGSSTIHGPSGAAKKAICLENKPAWRRLTDNMGHYQITMGFRRRKALVTRSGLPTPLRPPRRPGAGKKLPTEPDHDGPPVFWSVLLDSGATLPCLFEGDLSRLEINPRTYAAQSARNISTADDAKVMRIYDLDVTICSDLSAISPDTDVTTLGAVTIAVVAIPGSVPDEASDPSRAPDRLSGILPWHLCYVSSAPGNFKIWMGDERRDVLGAGRFPEKKLGQSSVSTPIQQPLRPRGTPLLQTTNLGTPTRIVFEHKLADGSVLVVRDTDEEGRGNLVVSGPEGIVYNLEDRTGRDTRVKSKGRLT